MEIDKNSKDDLKKDKSIIPIMGLILGFIILFVGFQLGKTAIKTATNSKVPATAIDQTSETAELKEQPKPKTTKIISTNNTTPAETTEDEYKDTEVLSYDENDENDDVLITEYSHKVEITDIVSTEKIEVEKVVQASYALNESRAVEQMEEDNNQVDENFVYTVVEKMPEFPGGDLALLKWISEHIEYPAVAIEKAIQGRISCSFIVNIDGSVSDIQVIRPVNPYLDQEAVRVLQQLPKFKPGEQNGRPVRTKYSVPVRFQLIQ